MLERLRKNKEELNVVAPFANIYEKDHSIVIAVEMPGADKNALDVHIDDNQLIIHGRKEQDEVGKEYELLHRERMRVVYERRFEINTKIDRDSIGAEYKDGVLKVSLTKSAETEPKKIAIQT